MKKIAFIVQQPRDISPGQRFRLEQWEPVLHLNGFMVDTYPFLDRATVRILYKKGYFFAKALGVMKGYLKRVGLLFRIYKYDYILLQREFAPFGPPLFEWIVIWILRKKVIYDFDDAIWIPNTSVENKYVNFLKAFWKVGRICKWSYKVSAGNEFLCDFAKNQGAQSVNYIPTVVDTETRYSRQRVNKAAGETVTIGWTGSHSTLRYLDMIVPVLQKLQAQQKFRFLVIADKDPGLPLKNYEFIRWNTETEIEDLLKIDIGVMPLTSDEWSEGKCGFKLIQYMALGIAALASPVGVNKKIVEQGVTGFLCNGEDDWYNALSYLLSNTHIIKPMGDKGRQEIIERYSIISQTQQFVQLFS